MNGDTNGELGSHEWEWSDEQRRSWVGYKLRKALCFVARGYSVEWFPDEEGWMDVYVPERHHVQAPGLRATARFFSEPSQFGIDAGRVSKLSIARTWSDPIATALGHPGKREWVFNYDRGADIDRLSDDATAQRLYRAVLEELN